MTTLSKPKANIETRIADRAKSIFAAFGTIVNDFYLEAGIYFVGGFNASLVAWDIYTNLVATGQPLPYAVILSIIAFIAVEGLAVYLVGAAAKTNNGLLWFFSVVFASFFTYAHYQEMIYHNGVISQYITLAIPFFVVAGYWARTIKADVEIEHKEKLALAQKIEQDKEALRQIEAQTLRDEKARLERIEDEERKRRDRIEDEEREIKRQLKLSESDKNHQLKMAKIEAEKVKIDGQNGEFLANTGSKLSNANIAKKDKIVHRRETILTIMNDEKLSQVELAERLGVSLGTVKNDLKALNGSVKI